MRVTRLHLEVLALQGGAVAHADDLQLLLVAVGDADDHVGEQRAREPVQAAVQPLVVGPLHADLPVLDEDAHVGVQGLREAAPGSLDRGHVALRDRHVDAAGDLDGLLADPTHPFITTRRP